MIKDFAEKLQTGLNEYVTEFFSSTVRNFRIFSDVGEMNDVLFDENNPRTPEEITSTVYGVIDADPSRLSPIPGLSVITFSGTLSVMVEAKAGRRDEAVEFEEAMLIEKILNGYGRIRNGDVYQYEDEAKKSFTITVNFSPAVYGDWQVHSSTFGEVLPLTMSIYLSAVENGVSANDLKVWVDGYPVHYESLTLTRQKVPDQYSFEREKGSKTTIVQHAFGVDFVAPVLRNRLSGVILRETLDGSYNVPHVVHVDVDAGIGGKHARDYLCTIGTNSLASQPGRNVGATLSFTEVKENLAVKKFFNYGRQFIPTLTTFSKLRYPEKITVSDVLEAANLTPQDGYAYACMFGLQAPGAEEKDISIIKIKTFFYGEECAEDALIDTEDMPEGSKYWVLVSYGE